jgi:hypothetical protein
MKKQNTLIYWIVTIAFLIALAGTGLLEIFRLGPPGAEENLRHVGYPIYILPFLGGAKVMGGIALLFSKNIQLREWAYAGFSFLLLGAAASHLMTGDQWLPLNPFGLLILVIVSLILDRKRRDAVD